MDESILEHLRGLYPGAFQGWDEFEVQITARNRKGIKPIILVVLYNKGIDGFIVDTHRVFTVESSDSDEDVIRLGGIELMEEFTSAYIPERFHNEKT